MSRNELRDIHIAIALAFFALLFYASTLPYDFLALDDDFYITSNPVIQGGLTWQGLMWAFSDIHFGYWLPLTWVSYMIDAEIFGIQAWGFRLTNILLFAVNVGLIYWILVKMTHERIPSACVAILFCVHPMRVESVVWIAERKDVLSGLFWLLAMAFYIRYVKSPSWRAMLVVAGSMLLGLMSKPILVVLPPALLLLDIWPLKRINISDNSAFWKQLGGCVYEKWPLFVLSGAFALLTMLSQATEGAVVALDRYPLWQRLLVIPANYLFYIDKTIWPSGLAALYADRRLSVTATLVALMIVVGLTVWMFRFRSSHPYLLIGWLWFLGTLFPVIGIVRVGAVELADRFTYLPHLGLLIMLAWGVNTVLAQSPRWLFWGSVALMAISLSVVTHRYAPKWRNNEVFFKHILAVNNHFLAAGNYGRLLVEQGKHEEALEYFQKSLQHRPQHLSSLLNYANTLVLLNRDEEAIRTFQEILTIDPQHAQAHNNLANTIVDKDDNLAETHYRQALKADPEYGDAHYNLGNLLNQHGRFSEAAQHYRRVLSLDPSHSLAHYNRIVSLVQAGKMQEAKTALAEWMQLDPNHPDALALHERLQ